MAGLNRIWRIGGSASSGIITDPAATVIEFDEATVGTNQQFMTGIRAEISVDISQTNALKGDINPSQDGGVGSVRIYINGVIKGKGALSGRQNLTRWLLEDKTTTNFPHGRFGTVFVNLPEYDITPVGTASTGYGWLIEDIEFVKDGEWKDKVVFNLTLKYNGSKTGIVSNLP
jgi:hypothetical protein